MRYTIVLAHIILLAKGQDSNTGVAVSSDSGIICSGITDKVCESLTAVFHACTETNNSCSASEDKTGKNVLSALGCPDSVLQNEAVNNACTAN